VKPERNALDRALAQLPSPELPPSLDARTLVLARAQLLPLPDASPPPLRRALPAYLTSTALISADAVFVADACLKISRAFGGS
jgi:hypothetical protein